MNVFSHPPSPRLLQPSRWSRTQEDTGACVGGLARNGPCVERLERLERLEPLQKERHWG